MNRFEKYKFNSKNNKVKIKLNSKTPALAT